MQSTRYERINVSRAKAAAVALAAFWATGLLIWRTYALWSHPISARRYLLLSIVTTLQLMAMLVGPYVATAKWPLGWPPGWGAARLHLTGLVAVTAFVEGTSLVIGTYRPVTPFELPLWIRIPGDALLYVLVAVGVQGARTAGRYYRTRDERLRLQSELETSARVMAEAELRALNSERNPHFLDNALQSVSLLIESDIGAADRVLGQLGELLRPTMSRGRDKETSVADELDAVEGFIRVAHSAEDRATARIELRRLILPAVRIALMAGMFLLILTSGMANDFHRAIGRGIVEPFWFDAVDSSIGAILLTALCYTALWVVNRRANDAGETSTTVWRRLAMYVFPPVAFGVLLVVEKLTVIPAMHYTSFDVTKNLGFNLVKSFVGPFLVYYLFWGLGMVLETVSRRRWTVAGRLRLQAELEANERRRVEAAVRALKAELNPHFVGNALSTVSSLMRTDSNAATTVLNGLRQLLRGSIAQGATAEVTLRDELATLEPFLMVERARLGRPLEIHWNVDAGALEGRVPHMILQPLVENAVKHGLSRRAGACRLEVSARRSERAVEITVRDDGAGVLHGAARSTAYRADRGTGLANVRARLAELYGGEAELELSPALEGGALARVSIPQRESITT